MIWSGWRGNLISEQLVQKFGALRIRALYPKLTRGCVDSALWTALVLSPAPAEFRRILRRNSLRGCQLLLRQPDPLVDMLVALDLRHRAGGKGEAAFGAPLVYPFPLTEFLVNLTRNCQNLPILINDPHQPHPFSAVLGARLILLRFFRRFAAT